MTPLTKVPMWMKIAVLAIAILTAVFGVVSNMYDFKTKTETAVVNSTEALRQNKESNTLYLELADAVKGCKTDMTLTNSVQKGEIAALKKDIKSLKATDVKNNEIINAQTDAINAQVIATTKLVENTKSLKEAVIRLENK